MSSLRLRRRCGFLVRPLCPVKVRGSWVEGADRSRLMNEEEAIWSVPVDYFRRNGGVPGWSDLFDKDV